MPDTDRQRLLFRDAMANLPAAVNIVTTSGEAGRCGITATAVCSVTDTPPTLMVCINRNSAMNPVFERNGKMCINVLSHAQEEMARHFAGMTDVAMEQRFALDGWHEGALGQPVLHQALASLEGEICEIRSIGTHFVYLLEIRHISAVREGHGLIYFRRRFHITPHEEMMAPA
jgi:flavin reductase (NADH)